MMSPVQESERVCRECWEDTGEPLIAPCACVGSLRFVHERCLEEVMYGDGFSCPTPTICGVCQEPLRLDEGEGSPDPAPPSPGCARLRNVGCVLGAALLLLHA